MEGTVKWYNRKKGYGFIKGEDGEDYFVHYSALKQGTFIRDNDLVSFEAADTDKGKQAQQVTLLKKGSEMGSQESSEGSEGSESQEESSEQSEEQSDEQ